ncbi:hypothetical protein DXG03_008202 [Asterophora parasitica]|uniref:3'-5' exonuclease domain-containing protein n=1 Tax=Asterophora parasitica TaxID=117018 RepID=A0A9P7GCK3_9AGAR|nr:hypothetical protein DXG03_008202 [Asterophora parasitica]
MIAMTGLDLEYTFCNTASSVNAALDILQNCSIVAFDCEGRKLGSVGGKLSLISLRPLHPSTNAQNFIFEVLGRKRKSLLGVYTILESEDIQKVVFDGRKDYSCLIHDRRIRLRNVLDLQLADIKSRYIRGERDAARLKRLEDCVERRELYKNLHLYTSVHKLSGLKGSAKEHIAYVPPRGPRFDHSHWTERPLPAEYMAHAVEDVVLIHQLYDHFQISGYLYPQLEHDSMRYVSIWKNRQPVEGASTDHGILPLGILDCVATGGELDGDDEVQPV